MLTRETQYDPSNDYYNVLGVRAKADRAGIARAHRAAVKKHHPDAGGDPTGRKIRAVNEAYSVLRDPIQRCWYNRSRKEYRRRRKAGASAFPGPYDRRRRSLARRLAKIAAVVVFAFIGAMLLAAAVAGVRKSAAKESPKSGPNSPGGARSHLRGPRPSAAASFGYATPFEPGPLARPAAPHIDIHPRKR